jgi:hypothetical protein
LEGEASDRAGAVDEGKFRTIYHLKDALPLAPILYGGLALIRGQQQALAAGIDGALMLLNAIRQSRHRPPNFYGGTRSLWTIYFPYTKQVGMETRRECVKCSFPALIQIIWMMNNGRLFIVQL